MHFFKSIFVKRNALIIYLLIFTDVIEVYKVICRIGLASKSLGKQTETLLNLLNEADQVWNTLCGFFAGSALMVSTHLLWIELKFG